MLPCARCAFSVLVFGIDSHPGKVLAGIFLAVFLGSVVYSGLEVVAAMRYLCVRLPRRQGAEHAADVGDAPDEEQVADDERQLERARDRLDARRLDVEPEVEEAVHARRRDADQDLACAGLGDVASSTS